MLAYAHNGFMYSRILLEDYADILPAIHEAHFAETEGYFKHYPKLKMADMIIHQKNGILQAYGVTAQESGKLAALLLYYVSPSLHCDAYVATDDRLYVLPEYRGAGIAKRLLKYGEKRLKEFGVTDIFHGSKSLANGKDIDRLYVGAGYQAVATVFHKGL